MSFNEIITIVAIVLGPILAVQIQSYLDATKEDRSRKDQIFRTLMATRATGLSQAHVQALNTIDVAFYGKNKKSKKVIEAWKNYHDHLNSPGAGTEIWGVKKLDIFIDLMQNMAESLGYNFDRTTIKNSSYFPTGHGDLENDQIRIRKGLIEVVEGRRLLPFYFFEPQLKEENESGIEQAKKIANA